MKTTTAIKAALSLGNIKVHVVVPSLVLLAQWRKVLAEKKLEAEVYVINTYIKTSMDCDMLIVDEVHTMSNIEATVFNHCILSSKWKYFLALSATVNKEHLLTLNARGINEVATISFREAVANGWVVPVQEYNIIIELPHSEREVYNSIDSKCKFFFRTFFNDYKILKRVLEDSNFRESYAVQRNRGIPTTSPAYLSPTKLYTHAIQYMANIKKRKDFIYNSICKVETVSKILERHLEDRIIIFSESTAFCQILEDLFGIKQYHSKVKPKEKKANMDAFLSKEINAISGAKSLDAGFDDPTVNVGIICSSSSSDVQHRQRLFRVARFEKEKMSFLYNLILKDTQEVNWTIKKQKHSRALEISSDLF